MDYSRYYDVMGEGISTMVTSRVSMSMYVLQHASSPIPRTVGRICDEIERVSIWAFEKFISCDDTFNVTNQRVHDLCDEIIRRDLKFLDRSFQSEGVDRPLLEKMKAGALGFGSVWKRDGRKMLRLKKM